MNDKRILILGIGNVLWADEGFGVRCIEELNRQYSFADNVLLMDGGTQGIYLTPHVQECDILVIFDAIDYGLEPGEMKLVKDRDVPSFMGAKKLSLHQMGFQEVMFTADLLGDYPEKVILIGVQPFEIEDFGGSLRADAKKKIEPCLKVAIAYLDDLGVVATKRKEPLSGIDNLSPPELALEHYESGRPSVEEACRQGDDRVLNSSKMVFDPKPSPINDPLSVDVDYRGQYDK
ncbi:MAG: HyaD/HybD family hydrogenase maturation endopeptidase [Methylophaga sp.]|nr:HyaD/HybD family hydrogenase maturation endopeptidase [Methylophaga sp.]